MKIAFWYVCLSLTVYFHLNKKSPGNKSENCENSSKDSLDESSSKSCKFGVGVSDNFQIPRHFKKGPCSCTVVNQDDDCTLFGYITGSIWKTDALKDQTLIKNFLGSPLNLFKGKKKLLLYFHLYRNKCGIFGHSLHLLLAAIILLFFFLSVFFMT